jgi:hypothetical protein
MILIIFFILGYISAIIYEFVMKKVGQKIQVNNGLIMNGYLLHHSIYGLLFIFAGVFLPNERFKLLAVGMGIIIQHYFTGDGLVFITKKK